MSERSNTEYKGFKIEFFPFDERERFEDFNNVLKTLELSEVDFYDNYFCFRFKYDEDWPVTNRSEYNSDNTFNRVFSIKEVKKLRCKGRDSSGNGEFKKLKYGYNIEYAGFKKLIPYISKFVEAGFSEQQLKLMGFTQEEINKALKKNASRKEINIEPKIQRNVSHNNQTNENGTDGTFTFSFEYYKCRVQVNKDKGTAKFIITDNKDIKFEYYSDFIQYNIKDKSEYIKKELSCIPQENNRFKTYKSAITGLTEGKYIDKFAEAGFDKNQLIAMGFPESEVNRVINTRTNDDNRKIFEMPSFNTLEFTDLNIDNGNVKFLYSCRDQKTSITISIDKLKEHKLDNYTIKRLIPYINKFMRAGFTRSDLIKMNFTAEEINKGTEIETNNGNRKTSNTSDGLKYGKDTFEMPKYRNYKFNNLNIRTNSNTDSEGFVYFNYINSRDDYMHFDTSIKKLKNSKLDSTTLAKLNPHIDKFKSAGFSRTELSKMGFLDGELNKYFEEETNKKLEISKNKPYFNTWEEKNKITNKTENHTQIENHTQSDYSYRITVRNNNRDDNKYNQSNLNQDTTPNYHHTIQQTNTQISRHTVTKDQSDILNQLRKEQEKNKQLETQYKNALIQNQALSQNLQNANLNNSNLTNENNKLQKNLSKKEIELNETKLQLANAQNEKENYEKELNENLNLAGNTADLVEKQNNKIKQQNDKIENLKKSLEIIQKVQRNVTREHSKKEKENKKLQTKINDLTTKLNEAENNLKIIKDSSDKKTQESLTTETNLNTEINSLKKQIEDLGSKQKDVKSLESEVNRLKKENEKLNEQMKGKTDDVKYYKTMMDASSTRNNLLSEKELKQKKEIDKLKSKITKLEKNNKRLKQRITSKNSEITNLTNENKTLTEHYTEKTTANTTLTQDNDNKQKQINQLQDQKTDDDEKITKLNEQINQLKEKIGKLQSPKTDDDNEKRSLNDQIIELQTKIFNITNEKGKLERQNAQLKATVNRLENQKINDNNDQIIELQTQIFNITNEKGKLERQNAQLEATVNRLEKQKINDNNEQINQLQKQKTDDDNKIKDLDEQINQLRTEINRLQGQKTDDDNVRTNLTDQINFLKQKNYNLSEENYNKDEEILKLRQSISELQNKLSRLQEEETYRQQQMLSDQFSNNGTWNFSKTTNPSYIRRDIHKDRYNFEERPGFHQYSYLPYNNSNQYSNEDTRRFNDIQRLEQIVAKQEEQIKQLIEELEQRRKTPKMLSQQSRKQRHQPTRNHYQKLTNYNLYNDHGYDDSDSNDNDDYFSGNQNHVSDEDKIRSDFISTKTQNNKSTEQIQRTNIKNSRSRGTTYQTRDIPEILPDNVRLPDEVKQIAQLYAELSHLKPEDTAASAAIVYNINMLNRDLSRLIINNIVRNKSGFEILTHYYGESIIPEIEETGLGTFIEQCNNPKFLEQLSRNDSAESQCFEDRLVSLNNYLATTLGSGIAREKAKEEKIENFNYRIKLQENTESAHSDIITVATIHCDEGQQSIDLINSLDNNQEFGEKLNDIRSKVGEINSNQDKREQADAIKNHNNKKILEQMTQSICYCERINQSLKKQSIVKPSEQFYNTGIGMTEKDCTNSFNETIKTIDATIRYKILSMNEPATIQQNGSNSRLNLKAGLNYITFCEQSGKWEGCARAILNMFILIEIGFLEDLILPENGDLTQKATDFVENTTAIEGNYKGTFMDEVWKTLAHHTSEEFFEQLLTQSMMCQMKRYKVPENEARANYERIHNLRMQEIGKAGDMSKSRRQITDPNKKHNNNTPSTNNNNSYYYNTHENLSDLTDDSEMSESLSDSTDDIKIFLSNSPKQQKF